LSLVWTNQFFKNGNRVTSLDGALFPKKKKFSLV
jgi:hypothetical protein